MPTGRVKWYDPDRGFGFVSNPEGEDVYVGSQVLPDGTSELHKGQRIEYDFAEARKGPQAMRISVLDDGPPPSAETSGGRGPGKGAGKGARGQRGARGHRYSPDQLHELVQDTVTLLESRVQPSLEAGRRPDRKEGRQVAEILRTIASELES
ncbi:cold-shock protein [Corynebacterium sp. AOP12-C2-36]|uniref:cold-shock protein n=1 Tax=Corynebacterium sp. AOP12-C2-36 TaxID=3457723 RepID=UPI00403454D2